MATAIKFIRNKHPHFAGDKIGCEPATADRLISAGIAVKYDIDAEARASAPKKPAAEPAKSGKNDGAGAGAGAGGDGGSQGGDAK